MGVMVSRAQSAKRRAGDYRRAIHGCRFDTPHVPFHLSATDMEALKDLARAPAAEKRIKMGAVAELAKKQAWLQRDLGRTMIDDAKQGERMVKTALMSRTRK
jgi:hypothetical protein